MRGMTSTGFGFGCEGAARRTVSVGSVTLALLEWRAPGRPGLCFLHGGSAHAHWFDLVVPEFTGRFHAVSLDQRGHGESEWPDPPSYATEDFTADLLGVIDALGWDQVILVGHSMGGHNAMAFAAWHPERVRALVIADSRPAIPPERLGVMRRRGQRGVRVHPTEAAAVASFRLLPPDTLAQPAFLRHLGQAAIARRDGGWAYRFDPNVSGLRRPVDNWTLIDRIAAPTLIVRGERSPVLPGDMAERLRDGIRNSRLAVVPEAFHHLVLDRPREFATVLDGFLKEIGAG
jgi:pimeloyl-ACP methyl ester carboxylesterase